MKEEYKKELPSYEAIKLDAILGVLAAILKIEVKDEFGLITITNSGKKIATIDISSPIKQ